MRLILKTAVFVTMVASLFLVGAPNLIFWLTRSPLAYDVGPARWLGVLPIALGAALFAYTMFSLAYFGEGTPAPFDPPRQLVVRGPYRRVRNPGYLGAVIFVAGESIVLQSYGVLLYAAALWTMFHVFVVLYEEPGLVKRFGKPYQDYCRTVPRWVPRL